MVYITKHFSKLSSIYLTGTHFIMIVVVPGVKIKTHIYIETTIEKY